MFKALIFVTLRESVLDPQGVAVKNSLHSLGYQEVEEVRVGKQMEVLISCENRSEAEARVREICEKLLANPVMENYTFKLEEVA